MIVLTRLQLGRNPTFIRDIRFPCDWQLVDRSPSLSVYIWWHRFQTMRYDYRGMWTGLRILEAYRLMWRRLLLLHALGLCSRDLAWASAFGRSARSSILSASVIVSSGYCLFLVFFFIWNYIYIHITHTKKFCNICKWLFFSFYILEALLCLKSFERVTHLAYKTMVDR